MKDSVKIVGTAKKPVEMVNSPAHYQLKGGKEVIDWLEEFGLGPEFCLGNYLKYIARMGKKFADKKGEDFQKAQWYKNRLIKETGLPPFAVGMMCEKLLEIMGVGDERGK